MKIAVMFAGVDALDIESQRHSVLHLPEVAYRVFQAQSLIDQLSENNLNLSKFIDSSDREFHANLPLKALAAAVVQVGLYDRYLASNAAPDYLVGCSLGDTARTVCSGAAGFEEMVYGTYLFNQAGQKIAGGAIVRVKSLVGELSEEQVSEIQQHNLTVA